MPVPKNVHLKILLLQQGVKLSELADYVGRSRPWVSQVISGEIQPTAGDIRLIADRLGKRPMDLKLSAR